MYVHVCAPSEWHDMVYIHVYSIYNNFNSRTEDTHRSMTKGVHAKYIHYSVLS